MRNQRHDISELKREIPLLAKKLLIRDRARLAARIAALDRASPEELAELHRRMTALATHARVKEAEGLNVRLSEDLPISKRAEEIAKSVRENPVTIVCGATGSGKTTQLPKIALSLGFGRYGRIGCTQPRRLAASSLARRLAAETGCEYGSEVGCKVRFDDRTSERTVVKFMTDGILLAETRFDPRLLEYDCLILDEVHERTLNIDFLLGCVKRILEKRRNLRVIVSSATLDSDRVSAFFSGAPAIEVEGRLFPIEDLYLPPEEDEDLSASVARAVEALDELDPDGDALVFLPGEREIRECAELLEGRRLPRTEILPLFGRLSSGDQQKVFRPGGRRRIVLATNVAETSLTIPGIRVVIDSGLARLSRYNPRSRIQELRVEEISKASARQRRGRCGRTQSGLCIHLYSEEKEAEFSDFTPPEIQRSSLAGVLLQTASLRLGPLEEFPLIDPPSPLLIREARQALSDLRAMDERGELTADGRRMAETPVDPHLARLLMSANSFKVLPEALIVAAWLSIPDPRERPFDAAKEADRAHKAFECPDSDFLGAIRLYRALDELGSRQSLRQFAKKNFYNARRLREWRNLVDDLKEVARSNKWNCEGELHEDQATADALHMALTAALPRQLAQRDPETGLYSDMRGRKSAIFPGSALAGRKKPAPWILSAAIVETSRVFARTNAVAQPQWLEIAAPHVCTKVYEQIHWDKASGFVYAREKVVAGQLVVHPGRRRHYAKIDPKKAREIFIEEALATGEAALRGSWLDRWRRMRAEILSMEVKMRRPGFLLNEEAVVAHFQAVLPEEICSMRALMEDWNRTKRDWTPDRRSILLVEPDELRPDDYPDFLEQSGVRFPLRCKFDPGEPDDGLSLVVPRDSLNLIDPCRLDYLVPGMLKEKIAFLLRSLPKSVRKRLMPLQEIEDAFMDSVRAGEVFYGQPLAASLCECIRRMREDAPDEEAFQDAELPEHLIMKILCKEESGRTTLLRSIPRAEAHARISHSLPAAKAFHRAATAQWPGDDEMPESTLLNGPNGVRVHPALTCDGDSFARELFLKADEARANHERAILRLWRVSLPQMEKTLNSILKLEKSVERDLFYAYRTWKIDAIDNAVREAMGGDLWSIRSGAAFARRLQASRDAVADLAAKELATLEKLVELRSGAEKAMRRLNDGSLAADDAREELDLYFRPGFLRTPELFARTPRYLKALSIRLERAFNAPEKDRTKGIWLAPFLRKIRLATQSVERLEDAKGILEFLLLAEEARIAVYAPEVRPLVKCGEAALAEAWSRLKLT